MVKLFPNEKIERPTVIQRRSPRFVGKRNRERPVDVIQLLSVGFSSVGIPENKLMRWDNSDEQQRRKIAGNKFSRMIILAPSKRVFKAWLCNIRRGLNEPNTCGNRNHSAIVARAAIHGHSRAAAGNLSRPQRAQPQPVPARRISLRACGARQQYRGILTPRHCSP